MATPVFECLRQNLPDVRITALTRSYNAKIIEVEPWLDAVIPCSDQTIDDLLKTAQAVRNSGADTAILLPNSIRSYLPVRMGGIKKIFGYRRGGRKIFLDGPLPKKSQNGILPMPMIHYYLELCKWLGLDVPDDPKPCLSVSEELNSLADQLFEQYQIKPEDRVIGFNPGAKFGSSKCWPPQYFANLADLMKDQWDCKILLFVGPGEDTIAEEICKLSNAAVINTGPDRIDLALLKPMIRRCDLLVTNDTGPRHYAVAFDRPVVVIMGPTDPRYTNSNLEHTIILRKDLPCAPCHEKECVQQHECMQDITPERVMAAAQTLLTKPDPKGQLP
ncbi:MAG: lipopolysaccharide heptosyltransferase II [Deltaproteobacteria bacterium]|jgi:heptosyltransferase-2|nr:lipopolysaccharide heptosyltransferase II [Deltaproteobacteria bacterium]